MVNAGVCFFPPQRFPDEEPHGEHRQGDVMVPPDPVPHLIVRHPRFALAAFDTFLDAVLCLRDPRQFHQRYIDRVRVRQIIVAFVAAVAIENDRTIGRADSLADLLRQRLQ